MWGRYELVNALSMLPGFYVAFLFREVWHVCSAYCVFSATSFAFHIVQEFDVYYPTLNKLDYLSQLLLCARITLLYSSWKWRIMFGCSLVIVELDLSKMKNRAISTGLSSVCIAMTIGWQPDILSCMSLAFCFYLFNKTSMGLRIYAHGWFNVLCHWMIYMTIDRYTLYH